MVVKNVAEGRLTDPEIWTPWTCVANGAKMPSGFT
jgi:hypothetical protein